MNKLWQQLAIATNWPVLAAVAVLSTVGVVSVWADEPGDGYVPLASTEWPGEESRLVIESNHEVHRQPAAILEIKRILLEHLGINAPDAVSAPPSAGSSRGAGADVASAATRSD